MVDAAARSRADRALVIAGWITVAVYNVVGLLDIYSTAYGIAAGLAEEVNPVMRSAMDHFGAGWIAAKLLLQALISFMILWFPHRIVLAIFIIAVALNAGVVWSNFRIAGLL